MSEGAVQEAGVGAVGAGAMGPTAGVLLRQAREAAGMHIAALAVSLKVPVGKLEALESDNFAALPDAVFARALASSVCRALKIDPAAVLERLPQSQPPRLATDSAGINATFKDPSAKIVAPLGASSSSRTVALAVLALLVGAAVVYFLPSGVLESLHPQASSPTQAVAVVQAPATIAQAPATVVEPVPAAEPTPAPVAAQEPAPAAAAVVASAPAPVAAPPVPAPVVSAAGAVAGEAAPPAAAPSGIVEFRANGESWVQVRDASGAVTFQRSLKAGETAAASGKPPLSVVVGKVNATEVFVRGAPFDLAVVARENVARFEVK